MKKKVFTLIAALCVAAMALAACGGGGSSTATTAAAADSGNDTAVTETTAEETTAAAASAGETYETEKFSFELPGGWVAFPQTDMFGEQDADGNYPVDPTSLYVSRDAKDEMDLFSKPYVWIKYYNPDTTIMSSRDWYKDITDLDVTIDGATVEDAYQGTSTMYDDVVWEYQIIQFTTDNCQFNITIPTIAEDNPTGLSYDDPEVATILNTLAGK